MSVKTVLDHWTRNGVFDKPIFDGDMTPRRPSADVIGLIVAWDREMRQLSVDALASLANVSVSTIERIERCEQVSDEALRKVAVALGREEGAFVDVRVPLDPDAALALLENSTKWIERTVEFPVRPLRTHRQLREIADAVAVMVDGGRLRDGVEHLVDDLREYLDLASFFRAKQAGLIQGGEPPKMRSYLNDVMNAVRAIERQGAAVALAGTYEAKIASPGPLAGQSAKVAVIAFFPKMTDPCAIKRPVLRAPEVVEIGWRD